MYFIRGIEMISKLRNKLSWYNQFDRNACFKNNSICEEYLDSECLT